MLSEANGNLAVYLLADNLRQFPGVCCFDVHFRNFFRNFLQDPYLQTTAHRI